MDKVNQRRAIGHLLDEKDPADASAAYYAFHHPGEKIQLKIFPEGASKASGYVCFARTGIDLFRPLVTLRLPEGKEKKEPDLTVGAELIRMALPVGIPILLIAPVTYRPLLTGLMDIQTEDILRILVLDRGRYQPIINVLVTRSDSQDGLPRFIARQSSPGPSGEQGEFLASAGLNWMSNNFGEIYVHTKSSFRRKGLGKSVVASIAGEILDNNRIPLYSVNDDNLASIQLAESVGFVDIGIRQIFLEGSLK